MAFGDVERSCDAGICQRRAVTIGHYTDDRRVRCTAGACSQTHVVEVTERLRQEGHSVDQWVPFPPRPASGGKRG